MDVLQLYHHGKINYINRRRPVRQQNGQKKIDQWTNNDLQNIILKTEDRVTRTPLCSYVLFKLSSGLY
jgi:hypothetical protein